MKIYGKTVKGKLLAYGIINLHTRNVKLGNGCCLGSFLAGIDNDVIEIEVANRCYGNSGSLSEVTNEGVCRSAYAVDGEEVVTGIGGYGYGRACGNVEGDESACLHVKSITVLVPSNVAILCTNVEACPIESAALCNSSSDVEGVGCTCGAGALIEVVVGSVILCYLGSIGIPRIKVRNLVIGGAEDYSEVKVHSSFLCGKESHTCNSLRDRACAGVVVLNELNSLVGGLNAGHNNVTLVLRSSTRCGGSDVCAKLGFDYCNCRICAPRTTDCGKAICNALVSGELTVIEDRAVGDSVGCALVRALEGGEITTVGLAGVNSVDHTILKEGGVVSTEDKVGVAVDLNALEVLTTGKELESILISEKDRVGHYKAISLNKESKSSVLYITLAESLVEVILGVEGIGNGNVVDLNVGSGISDSYGSGGVGGVSESTCIGKTEERIPLDKNVAGLFAYTLDGKVRNSDLKLFLINTGSDGNYLRSIRICLCKEVKSLLNGGEYVIGSAKLAYQAKISRINESLDHTVFIRSDLYASNVNYGGSAYAAVRNCNGDRISFGGIEALDLITGNLEFLSSLAALTDYGNRETCGIKLLAYEVELTEAVVEVNSVARSRVSDLLDSVEVELNALGSEYVYVKGNRSIILIAYSDRICAGYCKINLGGIDSNVFKSEGLGLAAGKGSVKLNAGGVKSVTDKVINLAGSNELKAGLCRYGNGTIERDEEYVLSTAVLTAADDPLTLGYVDLDLNNRAAIVVSCELDVITSTVRADDLGELSSRAAGTVLDKEAELTCAGNGDLDHSGGRTDLNRLDILNALKGLCSVSNLGARNDGKSAVYLILGASTGLKVAYINLIVNVLIFACVSRAPLSVKSNLTRNSVGGEVPSGGKSLVLIPAVELKAFLGRISRLFKKSALLNLYGLDSRAAIGGEMNVKLFDLGERNLFTLVLNLYVEEVVSACKVTDIVCTCRVKLEGSNSEILIIKLAVGLVKNLALVIPDTYVTVCLRAGVALRALTAVLPIDGNRALAACDEHNSILPLAISKNGLGAVKVDSVILRGCAAVGKVKGYVLAFDTALLGAEDDLKLANSYNLRALNGSCMLGFGIKHDGCRRTCGSLKLCAADITYVVFIYICALGKLIAADSTVVAVFCRCALGKLIAADSTVVAAVSRCALGKLVAADRAVVATFGSYVVGKLLAADSTVVATFSSCALGHHCVTVSAVVRTFCRLVLAHIGFTKVAFVVLVFVLVLARSRGVILFELCATVVADVVAVSVYVALARLVKKIANERKLINSGNLLKKTTGRKHTHCHNKHYY